MSKTGVAALLAVVAAVAVLSLPSALSRILDLLLDLRPAQAGSWFVLGALFLPLVKSIRSARTLSHEGDGSIYGLDHARLNLAVPPRTMWMNMGYWELTSDFPLACRALLDEVLITAKLLPPGRRRRGQEDSPREFKRPHTLTVIDLGFGCGDQTVYLMDEIAQDMTLVDAHTGLKRPRLVDRYVGVTESRAQFNFARTRLAALSGGGGGGGGPSVEIFCEDAAQPASWSEDLARAAKEKAAPPPLPLHLLSAQEEEDDDDEDEDEEKDEQADGTGSSHRQTWVLALDSLYHFSPSRQPILNHAYGELEASLMAFDLTIADAASNLDRALLAVVSLLAGIPFSNFVTAAQYRKMLRLAGYAERDIIIRDISEHVFAPLGRFMDQKDRELGQIGFGIGSFRAVKWIFQWWAKTGLVRGVVVVARR